MCNVLSTTNSGVNVGKTGAFNGKERLGNIKRHVNTTCRLRNNYVGRTMFDFFPKLEQVGGSESDDSFVDDAS